MITGAAGCIGSCLTKRLLSLREHVIAFDKHFRPSGLFLDKTDNLRIAFGDLAQKELLLSITKDVDIVFHLAAKVHEIPKNREEESEFFKVNVEGTKILLDSCLANRVSKFIFFSTVGTFEERNGASIDERSPVLPLSAYARSKYEAENLVLDYHQKYGLAVTILKLPVVYGPHDKGNVKRMIESIDRGQFRIIGNGGNLKSMLYVENAVDAAILVAKDNKANGKVYIVSDNAPYSIREIAVAIAAELGVPLSRIHLPKWFAYAMGFLCDMIRKITKVSLPLSRDAVKKLTMNTVVSAKSIKRELGFEPRFSLKEGMAITIDWHKSVKSTLQNN